MELKPCPFCGGKAEMETIKVFEWCERTFIVRCGNNACEVSPSVMGEARKETVEAWNRIQMRALGIESPWLYNKEWTLRDYADKRKSTKRLIDSDKVVPLVRLLLLDDPLADTICEQVQKLVDIHTIDAVEVVRCKDCEYYVLHALACRHEYMNGVMPIDGFCSNGKLRSHHDSLCDQTEEVDHESL